MVKKISALETLPLRSVVLRNGLALAQCIFPTDEIEDSFHLGAFTKDELVSIASFFPNNLNNEQPSGYQLRGMATNPSFAGKGYGASVVAFAISSLKSAKVNYIWCNARVIAVPFYQKLGFEIISDVFEVPEIGPHYKMKLNLVNT